MNIKVLAENTSAYSEIGNEHGLSLYIETEKHRLLFDTGASTLFSENAKKMGVALSEVDLAVISHGHYDHGGGIETFLRVNPSAKIAVRRQAFHEFYSRRQNGEMAYIGLAKNLLPNERFIFTEESDIIDDELTLFSNVKRQKPGPAGNADLFEKTEDGFVPDGFAHEQNLIIRAEGKAVLIAGCAHCGILNILERFRADNGAYPDVVVGGFHLYNRSAKKSEPPEVVTELGKQLLKTGARFYTCHCTGVEAYIYLKNVMDEKVSYLSSGEQINI